MSCCCSFFFVEDYHDVILVGGLMGLMGLNMADEARSIRARIEDLSIFPIKALGQYIFFIYL